MIFIVIISKNKNKMTNEPLLLQFGKRMLEVDESVVVDRRQFEFDFEINFDHSTDDRILKFIKENLELDTDNVTIIHKTLPEKGLGWHIDDCQVVTMKTPPVYRTEYYSRIPGTTNKYLYLNPSNTLTGYLARYTVLLYSSSWGKDFKGGELHLADGTRIRPEKGHGVLLRTKEVHMVTPIRDGVRKVTVVKIY